MNDISFNRVPGTASGMNPVGGRDRFSDRGAMVSESFLVHYLRLAKRWKWLLLASVVSALLLGLLVTLLMTPKYTASATIEIQREGARVVNVQGVEPETSPVDLEFYQTQYGLLRSETLAQRVATELRLYDNAGFFEMFGNSEVADELREGQGRSNAAGRNERILAAAKILLDNLAVDPARLSRLVQVHFTSPDAPTTPHPGW